MLRTQVRIRIQEILRRLSKGNEVTLEERIYVNKYAARNQNVYKWLRKAVILQRKHPITDQIDELLNGLDLISDEPYSTYDPGKDDLGEWFSGSPSWIRRS